MQLFDPRLYALIIRYILYLEQSLKKNFFKYIYLYKILIFSYTENITAWCAFVEKRIKFIVFAIKFIYICDKFRPEHIVVCDS